MTSLAPVITSIGLKKVFDAQATGLSAVIAEVGLGDGAYVPADNRTALSNEKQRVPVAGGEQVADHQIQITALVDGALAYWVSEVGFYLADGTLFAVWSDPAVKLAFKSAEAPLSIGFDLLLKGTPPGSVTIETSAPPVNLFLTVPLARMATAAIGNMSRHLETKFQQLEETA